MSQINDLSFHIKKLEKEEKIKAKVSTREIIKIKIEINETEKEKNSEAKRCF